MLRCACADDCQCLQAAKLIRTGELRMLLWEGYSNCQGYDRCYAADRFVLKWPVAYQPLQFSVASLFLWPFRPFISFADLDEFMMINKEGQSVSQILNDPACFNHAALVLLKHYSIQTREHLAHPHGHHWLRVGKHSYREVLSEYIYRYAMQSYFC